MPPVNPRAFCMGMGKDYSVASEQPCPFPRNPARRQSSHKARPWLKSLPPLSPSHKLNSVPGQLITAWPNVHTNHMVDICDHKALKILPGRHEGQGQAGNGPRIEGNGVRARMKNGALPHSLWVVSSQGTGSSSVSPSLNHPIVGIKDPS